MNVNPPAPFVAEQLNQNFPLPVNHSGVAGSRLNRLLNYHAGNVPGTDQFFGAMLRKWQAISFFLSYNNNREATYFHTGSMAEYHDPFLRHLLSKYVSVVESPEAGRAILNDNAAFTRQSTTTNILVQINLPVNGRYGTTFSFTTSSAFRTSLLGMNLQRAVA
jgi:hypothetical protein